MVVSLGLTPYRSKRMVSFFKRCNTQRGIAKVHCQTVDCDIGFARTLERLQGANLKHFVMVISNLSNYNQGAFTTQRFYVSGARKRFSSHLGIFPVSREDINFLLDLLIDSNVRLWDVTMTLLVFGVVTNLCCYRELTILSPRWTRAVMKPFQVSRCLTCDYSRLRSMFLGPSSKAGFSPWSAANVD